VVKRSGSLYGTLKWGIQAGSSQKGGLRENKGHIRILSRFCLIPETLRRKEILDRAPKNRVSQVK